MLGCCTSDTCWARRAGVSRVLETRRVSRRGFVELPQACMEINDLLPTSSWGWISFHHFRYRSSQSLPHTNIYTTRLHTTSQLFAWGLPCYRTQYAILFVMIYSTRQRHTSGVSREAYKIHQARHQQVMSQADISEVLRVVARRMWMNLSWGTYPSGSFCSYRQRNLTTLYMFCHTPDSNWIILLCGHT